MSILLRLRRFFSQNRVLLLLWWVVVGLQPLIPVGNTFDRDDLVPWLMLSLGLTLLVRGAPLGDGPHPMLEPRRSGVDRMMRQAAIAALPVAAWFWYEAGHQQSLDSALIACGITAGTVALLAYARDDGLTAWNPPGMPVWLISLSLILTASLSVYVVGMLATWLPSHPVARRVAPSLLLGLCFLWAGLITGRSRNLRQRRSSGRRDGAAWRPSLFRPLLAFLGPSLGLLVLLLLIDISVGLVGFHAGFVAALHVFIWGAIVWPQPEPVAVYCTLHEIVPAGGKDKADGERARSFEQPPEGALRFHPLEVRRTRNIHFWLVPVRGTRIGEFDDPVRDLWRSPPAPRPQHILGEASFELEPHTRQPQVQSITVRLGGQQDTGMVSDGGAQTRRISVLQPYLPPGTSRRPRMATYRWERRLPAASLQVVDASTESITLTDGSIVLLSAEGVARAFEVEIGTPIYRWGHTQLFRPPQMEDYVGL